MRGQGAEVRKSLEGAVDFTNYRDLKVWQRAMDLTIESYALTNLFPDAEMYGLTSQIQRAVVSVPANIAEGHAIGLPKPFLRHLRIAIGSLAELETHFELAARLHYIERTALNRLFEHTAEVRRMLFGLKKSMERKAT